MTDLLLLTEEEAARRLLIHPRTLRKLRQAGEIRYVALVGRRIGYRPEDCQAYIERQLRLETPADPYLGKPRGRPRLRPQESGNVLSFTARRQARLQGRGA